MREEVAAPTHTTKNPTTKGNTMGESPATYEQADRVAALVRVVRARHLAHLRLTTEAMREIVAIEDNYERSRRTVVVFLHLVLSKTHPVTPECANQIITAAVYEVNGIDWAATEYTVRWIDAGRFYLDTMSGGAGFCMPVNLTADPVNIEQHPNVYLAPVTKS
ncbi:hypothetical protein [Micromonospora sp. NPDC051141]|uniref:hypothetical protein n=1 Tax=Micromonospora sp. NPDC051141 TaxID=3364284 RepID=UPI0037905101